MTHGRRATRDVRTWFYVASDSRCTHVLPCVLQLPLTHTYPAPNSLYIQAVRRWVRVRLQQAARCSRPAVQPGVRSQPTVVGGLRTAYVGCSSARSQPTVGCLRTAYAGCSSPHRPYVGSLPGQQQQQQHNNNNNKITTNSHGWRRVCKDAAALATPRDPLGIARCTTHQWCRRRRSAKCLLVRLCHRHCRRHLLRSGADNVGQGGRPTTTATGVGGWLSGAHAPSSPPSQALQRRCCGLRSRRRHGRTR